MSDPAARRRPPPHDAPLERAGEHGGHDHGSHDGGHAHTHDAGASGRHGHTHGVVDASIATSERGLWALKGSFIVLMTATILQVLVVALSHSVALLADTIHNF